MIFRIPVSPIIYDDNSVMAMTDIVMSVYTFKWDWMCAYPLFFIMHLASSQIGFSERVVNSARVYSLYGPH